MTSKLKLEIDALEVTTFDAGRAEGARGTVQGQWGTALTCGETCDMGDTCDGPVPSVTKFCGPETQIECDSL